MELVNKKYVKMNKSDIFLQLVRAGATEEVQNIEKVNFFQNLLNVVMDYERSGKYRIYLSDFYLKIDDIDIKDTEITRDTIVNALVYASITSDYSMVEKIKPYLYKKSYVVSIGNEILDYILEHGISPEEFIDGESERLIYNSQTGTLEYGYIHNHSVKLERRKK